MKIFVIGDRATINTGQFNGVEVEVRFIMPDNKYSVVFIGFEGGLEIGKTKRTYFAGGGFFKGDDLDKIKKKNHE